MPAFRPLPFHALALAGLALSTTACSRIDTQAADPAAQGTQDWAALKDFDAIDGTGPA